MWALGRRWTSSLCSWRGISSRQACTTALRLCSTSSSVLPSAPTAPEQSKGPVSLHYTCRLLDGICSSSQPFPVKRKRVRGAVRRMEADVVDSFAAASTTLPQPEKAALMLRWLQSLSAAAVYLPRREEGISLEPAGGQEDGESRYSARSPRRSRRTERGDGDAWSGASPFFSLQTNDVLCLCLRECAMSSPPPPAASQLALLRAAVELELGDVEVLQHLVHTLTKADASRSRSPAEAVQLLHFISLAVKRCKMPPPPLDRLLCLLPGATLSGRESLLVLSAVHRMPGVHAGDVVASVSRKAARHAATYTVKDVIFGLEAAALGSGCNEAYAAAVLDRAAVLAPSLTPRQLGSVCKYVALLNPSRRQNSLAYACGAELRRLLPLLVERAEQLLGQFQLRDSRNVLRCFREHKVRHSLIFSRLTPIAEDT